MKYRKFVALLLVAVLFFAMIPNVASAVGKDGWRKENGKWYFYTNGAKAKNCWKSINGYWYRFDSKGVMLTGWYKETDGHGCDLWYYLDPSGSMAEGWRKINGKWYWLMPGYGFMAVNIHEINGKYYRFDEVNGDMKTGWYHGLDEDGRFWMYFNSNGDAAVGWKKVNGAWYYFYPQYTDMAQSYFPKMACNETLTINGVQYTFDASGAWIE